MILDAITVVSSLASAISSLQAASSEWKQSDLTKAFEFYKSALKKPFSGNWRTHASTLNEYYNSGRLVLVLGAGISAEHGLPDWKTLLQTLSLDILTGERSKKTSESPIEVTRLLASLHYEIFNPNALVAARFIHRSFDSEMEYREAVRKALYGRHQMKLDSKLFKEIAQLCASPGRGPSLEAVINFNFDDLLERYLEQLPIEIPFASIFTPDGGDTNTLPIYHVHGFLPHDGNLRDVHRVILTEQEYHDQYKNIYDWSNIVQINTFARSHCLFLGTSLTDPNLRRLLDVARLLRGGEQSSHFTFRRRYNIREVKKAAQGLITRQQEIAKDRAEEVVLPEQLDFHALAEGIVNHQQTIEERDASSFGIGTLWVSEWDEILDILRSLRHGKHRA